MVFLKPSMIKVGFFLVAGSLPQVQRTTQKAERLQAEEVIPSSLPEKRSDIWQPQLAWSLAAKNRRAMCRWLHEPPKEKGSKTGQRWVSGQTGLQLKESSQVAAAAHNKKNASACKWKSSSILRNLIKDLKPDWIGGLISNKTRIRYLSIYTFCMTFSQISSEDNKKHLKLFKVF